MATAHTLYRLLGATIWPLARSLGARVDAHNRELDRCIDAGLYPLPSRLQAQFHEVVSIEVGGGVRAVVRVALVCDRGDEFTPITIGDDT